MVILHVIIALTSIIVASLALMRPSRAKLYANYGLIGATVATGTYLIVTMHVNMLSTCLSGLTYLSIVAVFSLLARHKLAQLQTGVS